MGCFICVLITYNPLRESVNMYVGSLGYSLLIILRVAYIAINSALKIFCKSGSLIASSMFLNRLYTPYPAFSLVQLSSICCEGRKEPSI